MTTIVYFLPMPRVLIIAFDGAQSLDVTGPAEVFASAARALGRPAYSLIFASMGGGERVTTSGLALRTRDLARLRARRDDTVVVAGGDEAAIRRAVADTRLAAWLRRATSVVGRMTSVCSGAFILAAAGILDGKRAATHWSACERLAQLFPRVTVDPNAIFVVDGTLWTSAGVTTGIDMALAMIERDHGRALADQVGARLVLYVRRPGFQSQFSDAQVAQASGSDPLGPAITWARRHLAQVDVQTLARRAALSVRTLHRRCRETLGTTPGKLIDKLRVEHARTLLEAGALSAKTLAAQCGFGNAARLRRAFARELGLAPREYRALHARDQATLASRPRASGLSSR